MRSVVAAFVGYAPNFELPWAVGTDHGEASFTLDSDKERCEWKSNNQPTWYGFVVKDDDGNYSYADRKTAYIIAKESDQMNDRKGNSVVVKTLPAHTAYLVSVLAVLVVAEGTLRLARVRKDYLDRQNAIPGVSHRIFMSQFLQFNQTVHHLVITVRINVAIRIVGDHAVQRILVEILPRTSFTDIPQARLTGRVRSYLPR